MKSKHPEEELILTGLIERVVMKKHSREIKISMHKATAFELVKVSNGLTYFSEEIMYLTDNSYIQKLYEIISHWKDLPVYSISIENFRAALQLENKYLETKDLLKYVIRPAEKELAEIGDVFNPVKTGTKITRLNFIIKHRKSVQEEEIHTIRLKEQAISLLRKHFRFKQAHFDQIKPILDKPNYMPALTTKIGHLWAILDKNRSCINNVPNWTVASLLNEFN